MIRRLTAITLIVTLFSGGCMMERTERTVIDYYGHGAAPQRTAPFKGDYVLYRIPKQGGYATVYRAPLAPPDKVGFQKSSDGDVDAIAGATNVPLEPGFYSWRARPAEGQYDSARTREGVVTTVLVIVGIGVVAAGVAALATGL